ncbi:MAG TPA: hypothetical protein VGM90_37750 [Kofleriaceae bacterium]|jgi:hypothetical protein
MDASVQIVMPGVMTPAAITWGVASVLLFVVGFVGMPYDMSAYSRAFAISMALRGSALVMFVVALVQTRAVKVVITATELICYRSGRTALHLPREGLRIGVEDVAGRWRRTYVIVASVNDKKVALATRIDSADANAHADAIRATLGRVRPA